MAALLLVRVVLRALDRELSCEAGGGVLLVGVVVVLVGTVASATRRG